MAIYSVREVLEFEIYIPEGVPPEDYDTYIADRDPEDELELFIERDWKEN